MYGDFIKGNIIIYFRHGLRGGVSQNPPVIEKIVETPLSRRQIFRVFEGIFRWISGFIMIYNWI